MITIGNDIEVTVAQDSQDEMAGPTNTKDDFYDFKSDDESTSKSNVDRI